MANPDSSTSPRFSVSTSSKARSRESPGAAMGVPRSRQSNTAAALASAGGIECIIHGDRTAEMPMIQYMEEERVFDFVDLRVVA